jgi:flagellar biosynthesis component FlhA
VYLSDDLDRTLKRYIGKYVSIFTFGGHRFVGRLESLLDGGLCLSNAERLDDYDESNWYSAMRDIERAAKKPGAGRETIVLFPQIVCISCPDENLEPIASILEANNDEDFSLADSVLKSNSEETQHVELIIGRELMLALQQMDESLLTWIAKIRSALSEEFGFSFPSIRINECSQMEAVRCELTWQGLDLGQMRFPIGFELLLTDNVDALGPGHTVTKDPVWHAPAVWLDATLSDSYKSKGNLVWSLQDAVGAFISSTLRAHCGHFYTFDQTSKLISTLRASSPSLVDETVERTSSLSSLHTLLHKLVQDRCTVRPLNRILTEFGCRKEASEAFEDNVARCRLSIARWICNAFRDESGHVRVIQLPVNLEYRLAHEKLGAELIQAINQIRIVHRAADQIGKSCLMVDLEHHRTIIDKLNWLMPNLAVVTAAEIEAAGAIPIPFPWPEFPVKSEAKKNYARPKKLTTRQPK